MHPSVQRVETISDHMLTTRKDLGRIPTVNPPGGHSIVIEDLTKTTQTLVQVALTLLE